MYKRKFFLLIAFLAFSACSNNQSHVEFRGETMGTFYTVQYIHPENTDYQSGIDTLLDHINNHFSTYLEQSFISEVNRSLDTVHIDADFKKVLKKGLKVAKESKGAFDPTVLPLVNLWGFGGAERSDPDKIQVDSVLQFIGYQKIRLHGNNLVKDHPNLRLDLNAVVKGYAVDKMGEFLEEKGISNYLVGIGGDMRARGLHPENRNWRVGIEIPEDDAALGEGIYEVINLDNQSIATSGDYRNFYYHNGRKYGHIIDPRTGYPALTEILSATVLHEKCMTADAYATAAIAMGLEKAKRTLDSLGHVSYLFIIENEQGELESVTSKDFLIN